MTRYTGSNVCSKPVALLSTLASIMVRVYSDRNPAVAEVRLPPPVAPENWKSTRILVWKYKSAWFLFRFLALNECETCFVFSWLAFCFFQARAWQSAVECSHGWTLHIVIQVQCFFLSQLNQNLGVGFSWDTPKLFVGDTHDFEPISIIWGDSCPIHFARHSSSGKEPNRWSWQSG